MKSKHSQVKENEKKLSLANWSWKNVERKFWWWEVTKDSEHCGTRGKKTTQKNISKHRARSSETCNFHLMVKTKLAALSDVCGRNTEGNYIINKGECALPSKVTRTTHWNWQSQSPGSYWLYNHVSSSHFHNQWRTPGRLCADLSLLGSLQTLGKKSESCSPMSLKRITKSEQTSFHPNFPGERKHKILPKLNSLILTRLRVINFSSAVVNACLLIPVTAILCWSTLISGTLTIPIVSRVLNPSQSQ